MHLKMMQGCADRPKVCAGIAAVYETIGRLPPSYGKRDVRSGRLARFLRSIRLHAGGFLMAAG